MLPDPLDYMMLKKHADDVGRTAARLFTPAMPKGRLLLRTLIAKTIGRQHGDIEEFCLTRWGEHAGQIVAKAAVPAFNLTDSPDLSPPAAEFFSLVMEQSIVGRLNLRQVPANVRLLNMVSSATAYWTGEGKATPMSYQSVVGSTLRLLKCQALVACTKESLEAVGEVGEAGLLQDLVRAVSLGLDLAFVDVDNSGIPDHMPASVTNGATLIASVGADAEDLRTDLAALFNAYTGDYASAALLMHPKTALQICLLQNPLGTVDLALTGGQLFGTPVYTSRAVPLDSNGAGTITLLDQSAIAFASGGYDLRQSDQTTLEMDDAPISDTAPAGAVTETTAVSLWQNNLLAFMSSAAVAWEVQGAGKVIVLTDVDYSGVS